MRVSTGRFMKTAAERLEPTPLRQPRWPPLLEAVPGVFYESGLRSSRAGVLSRTVRAEETERIHLLMTIHAASGRAVTGGLQTAECQDPGRMRYSWPEPTETCTRVSFIASRDASPDNSTRTLAESSASSISIVRTFPNDVSAERTRSAQDGQPACSTTKATSTGCILRSAAPPDPRARGGRGSAGR